MESLDYNKELINLLNQLLSENPYERPNIMTVISKLKSIKNPHRKRGFSLMSITRVSTN